MSDIGRRFGDSAKRFVGAVSETSTTFASATGVPYIVPALIGIVAVALIAMVVFVIIQATASGPAKMVRGPIDLFGPKHPVLVDRSTAKASMNGSYTWAFYIRLDAVPDMRADATPLFNWPGVLSVAYNPAQEQLLWNFAQTSDGTATSPTDTVVLQGIPLQRWTQVALAMEGRSFDLFVNGGLVESGVLRNVPPAANSSITVVPGGVMGKTAYVQLWSRRLTVQEVSNNYTDTSDSQGRPFLGPEFFSVLKEIEMPNLFCPPEGCSGTAPKASESQKWEFPYA